MQKNTQAVQNLKDRKDALLYNNRAEWDENFSKFLRFFTTNIFGWII